MSQIAREFIVDWLNENAVGADTIETEEDETPAEVLAARCRATRKLMVSRIKNLKTQSTT